MRTLLVSVDFTADSISATGGNRRFIPLREKRMGKRANHKLSFTVSFSIQISVLKGPSKNGLPQAALTRHPSTG